MVHAYRGGAGGSGGQCKHTKSGTGLRTSHNIWICNSTVRCWKKKVVLSFNMCLYIYPPKILQISVYIMDAYTESLDLVGYALSYDALFDRA